MKSILTAILLMFHALPGAQAQSTAGLMLLRTFSLPGVEGKFDHFAIDARGNHLFAAATGSHSVEVVDLRTGDVAQSLKGIAKPHGVAWISGSELLFVADGDKAELDVFKGRPLERIKQIPLSEDADDMVYDDATKLLYVGHGGAEVTAPPRVAVVDVDTLALVADIPVTSHPEALEIDPIRDRIFVNIADSGEVAVIDGQTHTVTAIWRLVGKKGNTPLVYDASDDELLVGCRNPAELIVLDGKTGKEVAMAPSSDGADDLFYDPTSSRAYLIAGSGAVDSFQLSKGGAIHPLAITHTIAGAKTGLLDVKRGRLYVGVPGTTSPSAIHVYNTLSKEAH